MSNLNVKAKLDQEDVLLRTRILNKYSVGGIECVDLLPTDKFFNNILYLSLDSKPSKLNDPLHIDILANTHFGSPYAWYVLFWINGIMSIDSMPQNLNVWIPNTVKAKSLLSEIMHRDAEQPNIDVPNLLPLKSFANRQTQKVTLDRFSTDWIINMIEKVK